MSNITQICLVIKLKSSVKVPIMSKISLLFQMQAYRRPSELQNLEIK